MAQTCKIKRTSKQKVGFVVQQCRGSSSSPFFFLARLADSWATREVVASPSGRYCSTVQNFVREIKMERKEIQSNIRSSPRFPFVASKQMLAISCAQDDTLNIDTDNVKVFMIGEFIFNCSCVAVFIYIQTCQQIHANVEHRGKTQRDLLPHPHPDPLSPVCELRENIKLGDKRDPDIHWERVSCAASLTPASSRPPSSCLPLSKHITSFWTRSWWITNGFCVWFRGTLCFTRRRPRGEQSQHREQPRAPASLSKPPLTIWWHLDELFVSVALFNLI